jgi:putative transposase
MDGKGRALDNVFIERLWRSVKYDYVYIYPAKDVNELFGGLKAYFEEYNKSAHQGINRCTPISRYKQSA